MMFYACLFLIALQSVHGGVRRQVVIPGNTVSQQCDTICDDETHELSICGSDGIEYKTRCEFNKGVCEASKAGDKMYMVNYGPCITLNTSCADAIHARCIRTSGSMSTSATMVCGSDKHTYFSACEFRHTQCLQQQQMATTQLTLDHMGQCIVDTSTQISVDCAPYFSYVDNNIAIESGNVVPHAACDKVYSPVCAILNNVHLVAGTYSRTFTNECSLCQYLMSSHQISMTNMTGYMSQQGVCPHNGLIG